MALSRLTPVSGASLSQRRSSLGKGKTAADFREKDREKGRFVKGKGKYADAKGGKGKYADYRNKGKGW